MRWFVAAHLREHGVEAVVTFLGLLAIPLDPFGLLLEATEAEPAGADAPDFLGRNEPSPLEDADMLLHARQGHAEPFGEFGDGRVRAPELLQHAAAGSIRERGERGVETGVLILNHMVQCMTSAGAKQGSRSRKMHPPALSTGTLVAKDTLGAH